MYGTQTHGCLLKSSNDWTFVTGKSKKRTRNRKYLNPLYGTETTHSEDEMETTFTVPEARVIQVKAKEPQAWGGPFNDMSFANTEDTEVPGKRGTGPGPLEDGAAHLWETFLWVAFIIVAKRLHELLIREWVSLFFSETNLTRETLFAISNNEQWPVFILQQGRRRGE